MLINWHFEDLQIMDLRCGDLKFGDLKNMDLAFRIESDTPSSAPEGRAADLIASRIPPDLDLFIILYVMIYIYICIYICIYIYVDML